MSDSPSSGMIWPLILAAAALGPATALLHEFGLLSLGPAARLGPLVVIVLAAVLGMVSGLRVGRHGLRRWRWLVLIPNGLVFCLYGFLLLFFGLGGSR